MPHVTPRPSPYFSLLSPSPGRAAAVPHVTANSKKHTDIISFADILFISSIDYIIFMHDFRVLFIIDAAFCIDYHVYSTFISFTFRLPPFRFLPMILGLTPAEYRHECWRQSCLWWRLYDEYFRQTLRYSRALLTLMVFSHYRIDIYRLYRVTRHGVRGSPLRPAYTNILSLTPTTINRNIFISCQLFYAAHEGYEYFDTHAISGASIIRPVRDEGFIIIHDTTTTLIEHLRLRCISLTLTLYIYRPSFYIFF